MSARKDWLLLGCISPCALNRWEVVCANLFNNEVQRGTRIVAVVINVFHTLLPRSTELLKDRIIYIVKG